MIATVAAGVLLVVGGVVSGFGLLVWLAIPQSDTATSTLLLIGLPFVVGGLVLAAVALMLLRRARRS